MNGATIHADTVRRHAKGPCRITETDWPYDCPARDDNPTATVYTCRAHNVWWHD